MVWCIFLGFVLIFKSLDLRVWGITFGLALGTIQVLRHHVLDFFKPTHLFDDLQYCKSSKIAIFWPHLPTSLMTWYLNCPLEGPHNSLLLVPEMKCVHKFSQEIIVYAARWHKSRKTDSTQHLLRFEIAHQTANVERLSLPSASAVLNSKHHPRCTFLNIWSLNRHFMEFLQAAFRSS